MRKNGTANQASWNCWKDNQLAVNAVKVKQQEPFVLSLSKHERLLCEGWIFLFILRQVRVERKNP